MGQIVLFDIQNRTVLLLNWVQTNDFYQTEVFEIELFDHLTGSKRITDG